MYLEDTPIKRQEEDLLHRGNFAKRLGKSLLDTDTMDGYCIGLFGPWGSGKSSVINMVLEEIDVLTKGTDEKPIVLYFNPWNFSSSEQLLQQYFLMLADKFSSQNDKRLNAIGNEIQKYAGMFDLFGNLGKALGFGGKMAAAFLKRKSLTGVDDISKQRELIVEKLAEQKQKIIVVIDDIDRLSNEEIKLIFQLVNSVAKFPNTIYLLSFDKEIVARALTEVQNYDGEKYLEKIIQVPIEIPEAPDEYLWNALFVQLDKILNSQKGILWEEDYWGRIFNECISKYIGNIRDVVRLINVLNLKCDMIGGEVNFADLVAVTVIEIKLPKLYRWIKMHQSRLTGGIQETFRTYNRQASEIKETELQELRLVDAEDAEEYFRLLTLLFPHYASATGSGLFYTEDLLRRKLRIGHPDLFSRYFALEMDGKSISREEFDCAISQMDESEMTAYLESVNRNGRMISFLKELKAAQDDLKVERIPVLIRVLFQTAAAFRGTDSKYLFDLSAASMAEYQIRDLFLKMENEEERFALLKDVIAASDENSISILANFINRIELAHKRLASDGEERGEKIISLDQLLQCEVLFTEKIVQISKERCLLDLRHSRRILYLYESFAKASYEAYMNDILQDDLNKLKFLGFSLVKWTGGYGAHWELNSDYQRLLDDDLLDMAIRNCEEDGRIWTLDEDAQHRVIAYTLLKEKRKEQEGDEEREVDDKKVMERIKEFRA